MKKILLLALTLLPITSFAQQIPLSESYFMDKYSLAPSYAGNYNSRFLFMGYRSDWSGIDGGPRTLRLSYNDILKPVQNVGLGGKIIYDKTGIFSQLYSLLSYTYNLKVNEDNRILFGLSTGIYKNRINLLDYYNDPAYNLDPSLISQDIKSKLLFMSEVSAVWQCKELEGGFMFSNITFGDASYKEVNLKYNPLANYQLHLAWSYLIDESWKVAPLAIFRGGKYIRSQFELASQLTYKEKLSGSLVYRDPGILGFGAGFKVDGWLIVGYNFNMATNVELGAFNNHEICLGLNFFEFTSK